VIQLDVITRHELITVAWDLYLKTTASITTPPTENFVVDTDGGHLVKFDGTFDDSITILGEG
jgi:hypothetical protein